MTPAERFWSYVAKGDGCWTWTGYIDAKGYGRVKMPAPVSKLVQAHRWAYEQLVGPIPDGLELDHLCRNRSCVNPAHLEAVTHAENVRRGKSPAAIHAAKETCPNGHHYDAVHRATSGRPKRVCKTDDARRRIQDHADLQAANAWLAAEVAAMNEARFYGACTVVAWTFCAAVWVAIGIIAVNVFR